MRAKLLKYKNCVATVEYIPSKIERLFGRKSKTKKLKYCGETYMFGDERCWYNMDTGERHGRYEWLDNQIRKLQWNG